MEILNHTMIHLLKYFALVQLGLFLILFCLVFGYRIYQERSYARKQKLKLQIHAILKSQQLSKADKQFLQKNLHLSVYLFYLVGKGLELSKPSAEVLLNNFFLQFIPGFAQSKDWYIRQLATFLLYLKAKYMTLDSSDIKNLSLLLDDAVPLVVMNAVLVISLVPTEELVTILIDLFSAQRRVQYDLFRILLQEADVNMVKFIVSRLEHEPDERTRGLCYRILIDLPKLKMAMPFLQEDLKSDYLDLSLTTLAFMVYARLENFEAVLAQSIESQIWQTRARAAKLIGKNCAPSMAKVVAHLLNDEHPWVRFRAAEALVNLGKIGIDILQSTTFPAARELAKQQLILHQQKP